MSKSLTERLTISQNAKLDKLITRLAKESKNGQIPNGVDAELYRVFQRVRETFFSNSMHSKRYRDEVSRQSSGVGIKHAWELIVKIGLYDSMLRENIE